MIHRVRAVNDPASSNLVHDDDFARRLGFRAGLVPGVDVYGYMAVLPAERWGESWLVGGTMTARFAKPVYDGEEVVVTAEERYGGLDLSLSNPAGEPCASGRAEPRSDEPRPEAGDYPRAPLAASPGPPEFAVGHALGTLRTDLELRDHAWPARLANQVLVANAKLPPWIHVESRTRHLGAVHEGQPVEVRARVAGTWERRGHRFVDLDVLVLDTTGEPLAQLRHVAIVELAQMRG